MQEFCMITERYNNYALNMDRRSATDFERVGWGASMISSDCPSDMYELPSELKPIGEIDGRRGTIFCGNGWRWDSVKRMVDGSEL